MSDGDLKFPQWQEPLRELILEFDREQVLEKLPKVEGLILERLRQLRQGSDGHGEQDAISDALSLLGVIRRDKLGIP